VFIGHIVIGNNSMLSYHNFNIRKTGNKSDVSMSQKQITELD
jgi:hypothetical protein